MINFLFKVFVGGEQSSAHNHFKHEISNRSKGCVEAACRRPASTQPLLLLRLHENVGGGSKPEACLPQHLHVDEEVVVGGGRPSACCLHQQLLLLLLHVYVGRGAELCSPNINIEVVVFEKVVVGRQQAGGLPPNNYLFKQYFSWCWDGSMPEACRPNTN